MVETKTNMLQTELCGITLDNPVMAASGTFGYGREFAELYDINCLGSFSFKGTTLEPRFGNPTPRIAECEAGLINSIGLQNPGVEKVIEEELPHLATIFDKKVMANIGGFSVEEYAQVAQRLDLCDQIGWIEVNISCPNVRHGGIAFGTDPDAAASVIRAVKDAVRKPVIAKLSPNVTDITKMAIACENAGADGISLVNTLLGMRIDLKTKKPVIANKMGGFSGLVNEKKERQIAEEQVKKLNTKCSGIDQMTVNLSGGNQQKVIIGKWLAVDSEVFIFDEPTKGIDVGAKSEIYDIMRGMADQGKAIIMVSSEMPELLSTCDRIIVFRNGEISGILNNEEATEEKIMYAAVAVD